MTSSNAGTRPQEVSRPVKQKNTLGLIALIVAAVGFIFACIPGALIVGWILLPTAFILSIVGLVLTGRRKGTSITALILSVVGTIVGVIVFMAVAAGAVSDAFNGASLAPDSPSSVAHATPDKTADTAAKSGTAALGTRAHPLAIGEKATNRDWTISLGTPHEATDAVLGKNPFNTAPAKGKEDWIVPVTATYTGTTTGEPALISVSFVSTDGHTYDELNADCGVIDTPLTSAGELYPNATAKGDICLQVPAGADGLWNVTAGPWDDQPVFFTMK